MDSSAFLFGKLPAHGDFVSRGLTAPQAEAWDAWATVAIETLRSASADFEAAHDAVPPWRFVAGPSALGPRWRAGALAPSVDAAGRRFVAVIGVECAPAQAAACGLAFAEQAEHGLYRALGEGLAADDVIALLDEVRHAMSEQLKIADVLSAAPAGTGGWWAADTGLEPRAGAQPAADLLAAACLAGAGDAA
ncbi:MAG TPA: type VI secretion system-associated protein TagF [Caulobacteraceae bacterium]|jgi:type VI secretion system protein ImpM